MAQKDVLKQLVDERFPDNDDGLITPAIVRQVVNEIIDFVPEEAGGDLEGTYPNPKVMIGRQTHIEGEISTKPGALVETDIPNQNASVFGEISGYTHSAGLTPLTTFQFYNNAGSNTILSANACHYGVDFGNISVFIYKGKICLWIPYTGNYQSYNVLIRAGRSTSSVNHVATITSAAMPSDITRRTDITPIRIMYKGDTAAGDFTGTFPNPLIADGKVGNSKLGAGSVTTSKIQDLSITPDKLASDSVTNSKLADNSVSNRKIQDNTVSTEKLQDNAVSTKKVKRILTPVIGKGVSTMVEAQYKNLVDLFSYDISTCLYTVGIIRLMGSYASYYIDCSMNGSAEVYPNTISMMIQNMDTVNKNTLRFTQNMIYGNHRIVLEPNEKIVVTLVQGFGGFMVSSVLKYDPN